MRTSATTGMPVWQSRRRDDHREDRRLQPLRGDLRAADHPRGRPGDRRPRQPRRPALPRPHLPQGRRARRPPRTTPTGCGGRSAGRPGRPASGTRSAGTRRSTWSPTASPTRSTGTAATRSAVYLGNPNAHSLGFATHGIAMVKALRTRNRFSASIGRPGPPPARRVAAVRPPAADPDPRHRPHVLLPGLRRQPDGLQRLADDGARTSRSRLRELKARGGRMVVVDPRRTETARVADEHLFVRPGTDAVRAAGDAPRAVRGGADPPGGVRRRRRAGRARRSPTSPPSTPRRSAACPPTTVRRLARELAAADGGGGVRPDRAVDPGLRHGLPVGRRSCLNLLTGNLDREGGVLFTEPAIDFVTARLIGRGHHDLWRSRVRGAAGVRRRAAGVGVRARRSRRRARARSARLLTIAGNPVLSTPDGKRLGAALAALDFMAAVDIYVNETTRHADVILPPTTILERDHYDLVFHGLAVRNTARFTPAVFDKPRGRPPRLGDLPRPDAADHRARSTAGRRCAAPAPRSGCG